MKEAYENIGESGPHRAAPLPLRPPSGMKVIAVDQRLSGMELKVRIRWYSSLIDELLVTANAFVTGLE